LEARGEQERHRDTPAHDVRRALESGAFVLSGDGVKVVHAMIEPTDQSPAPRRLVMAGRSCAPIRAVLQLRITKLDAHRDVAMSTDAD